MWVNRLFIHPNALSIVQADNILPCTLQSPIPSTYLSQKQSQNEWFQKERNLPYLQVEIEEAMNWVPIKIYESRTLSKALKVVKGKNRKARVAGSLDRWDLALWKVAENVKWQVQAQSIRSLVANMNENKSSHRFERHSYLTSLLHQDPLQESPWQPGRAPRWLFKWVSSQ